jgi:hypothetical protein
MKYRFEKVEETKSWFFEKVNKIDLQLEFKKTQIKS